MAQNAATQFGWNQFALWNDRLSGIELFNREYTKEKLYSFLFRMAREQEKFNISQNNPCYQDVRRVIRTFFFWYLDNTQWNELLAINTISAPPNTENPLMDLPNPLPWADSTTNYSPLWTRQAYGPWDRRKNRSGNRSDPLIVRAPGSWDITVQQNITWAIADHGTALSYLFSVMEEQPSCSPNSRGGPETHIVPALAMYTQMLKLLATDNEHVEGIGYNPEIRRVVDIVNKMPRTTCVIWPRYAHPNAAAIIQLPPIFGATLVGGKKGTETNDYPPKFRDAYGNTGTGAERAALQTTLDNVIRGHARTGLYGKRKATSRRFQNLQQPIANCPGNPGDTNRLPPVPPMGESRALENLKTYLRENWPNQYVKSDGFPPDPDFNALLKKVGSNKSLRNQLERARKSVGELLLVQRNNYYEENLLALQRIAFRYPDGSSVYNDAVGAFALHVVDEGVHTPRSETTPQKVTATPLPDGKYRKLVEDAVVWLLDFRVVKEVIFGADTWYNQKFGNCAETQPLLHYTTMFQRINSGLNTTTLLPSPIPHPGIRTVPVTPYTDPNPLHILEGMSLESQRFASKNNANFKFTYENMMKMEFMEACPNCRGLLRIYKHSNKFVDYQKYVNEVMQSMIRNGLSEPIEKSPALW